MECVPMMRGLLLAVAALGVAACGLFESAANITTTTLDATATVVTTTVDVTGDVVNTTADAIEGTAEAAAEPFTD